MKITYIARHNQLNTDDEGAITYALRQLGHYVQIFQEGRIGTTSIVDSDLCLFHKWDDTTVLHNIRKSLPKMVIAFWYFDLIDYPDPGLRLRSRLRRAWMRRITPLVDLGFCTDGDWVEQDTTGKLHWLMQGADGRYTQRWVATEQDIPILFVGGHKGGQGRSSFVAEMRQRWGDKFKHVRGGCYQQELAKMIARSKIIVAPDHPFTDKYWSNRIYLTSGFGGFLLHPISSGIIQHYQADKHIVYYGSRKQLHELIETYLPEWATRRDIGLCALMRTNREHLYIHRCKELIEKVQVWQRQRG